MKNNLKGVTSAVCLLVWQIEPYGEPHALGTPQGRFHGFWQCEEGSRCQLISPDAAMPLIVMHVRLCVVLSFCQLNLRLNAQAYMHVMQYAATLTCNVISTEMVTLHMFCHQFKSVFLSLYW